MAAVSSGTPGIGETFFWNLEENQSAQFAGWLSPKV
jgi:hypothetical protein